MADAAHSARDSGCPNEFRHDASSSARLPGWQSRLCVSTHAQTERGSPKRDTAHSCALALYRSPTSGTKGGRGASLWAGAECCGAQKRPPQPRMKIPRTGPKRHDKKSGNTATGSHRTVRAAVVEKGPRGLFSPPEKTADIRGSLRTLEQSRVQAQSNHERFTTPDHRAPDPRCFPHTRARSFCAYALIHVMYCALVGTTSQSENDRDNSQRWKRSVFD